MSNLCWLSVFSYCFITTSTQSTCWFEMLRGKLSFSLFLLLQWGYDNHISQAWSASRDCLSVFSYCFLDIPPTVSTFTILYLDLLSVFSYCFSYLAIVHIENVQESLLFQSFLIASYSLSTHILNRSNKDLPLSVFSYCFDSIFNTRCEEFPALSTFQSFLIASGKDKITTKLWWERNVRNLSVFSYCFTIIGKEEYYVDVVEVYAFSLFLLLLGEKYVKETSRISRELDFQSFLIASDILLQVDRLRCRSFQVGLSVFSYCFTDGTEWYRHFRVHPSVTFQSFLIASR